MRKALGARRATLSGPRSRSFLLAVPGILVLLHSAASAAKPQSALAAAAKTPISRVATASGPTPPRHCRNATKHATRAKKANRGAPASTTSTPAARSGVTQPAQTTHARPAKPRRQELVTTLYDDSSKLIIPQGDGSPVLSIAAHYLGRPYQFGSEGSAFDCSGFVRTVFADMGVDLPHSAREISAFGDRVARDDLEPGDLVFFRNADHRYATHVGIYVGDDKFVHAARHGGQVQVDSLNEAYYAQHYFFARRIEI